MRIRLPFAGTFATLLLLATYTTLLSPATSSTSPLPTQFNPLLLHALTLLALTTSFYWSLDTTRRRILHLTLLVCGGGLGVGSEVLRAAVISFSSSGGGGGFEVLNVIANLVGMLAGLGLCAWYHRRMVERKRLRKYTAVPTGEGEEDLELGEGPGLGGQTLEEEVDNWDENAIDAWDEEDDAGDVGAAAGKDADAKKRAG
ncbi:hypothetical protein N658DRAFT_567498 [Parathielavia hyrcaniae]|uniref:VanZ-like domain-containing protein n=1 Tax=Parathielavia hyrcaniae TaxID=113614 RepID=A0AAN6PYN2_9PEZI|nr:hypothetical protein N658DRAFT_567498 [Parathielavia hyrcaniae]